MAARLRLADILGGLSIVADLGMALPPEEAMRSCLIATAVARQMGLANPEITTTFYTALLFHLGCVSFSHEMSQALGDELRANGAGPKTDFSDPRDVLTTFIPGSTRGMKPMTRAKAAAFLVTNGKAVGRRYETNMCEVARETARRIGLPDSVQGGLYEIYEWWNGRGVPRGLKGDGISVSARIARVARDAAVFDRLGGADLAVATLRGRAGRTLDPSIVELFGREATSIFKEATSGDSRQLILEAEPEPVVEIDEDHLPDLAAAFGDLADLKTPYTHGHSGEVGRLARAAAERLGMDLRASAQLHVAALLHDLGRVGVSDAIWEKEGPLTAAEWEQVRIHAYHSERILATSGALEPMARIAGAHHERLDGSGYHRESRARDIAMPARVLAAADVFQALTQKRPHRAAQTAEQASETLTGEAASGRLDPDAVSAVLHVAGQPRPRARRDARPASLSDREVEVLRLVAEGCSNPEIARRLYISRRTAEHHVQHIYTKIGVTGRPAAALFALEHEILVPSV